MMFINPTTFEKSDIQQEGMFPLVNEDPINLEFYTLHADEVFTVYPSYVGVTCYQLKGLDTLKESLITKVNERFEIDSNAGFMFDGYLYASTNEELIKIAGVFAMAVNDPTLSMFWIPVTNEIVSMSNSDLKRFGVAAVAYKAPLIYARRILKNNILAATSIEQLVGIASASGYSL